MSSECERGYKRWISPTNKAQIMNNKITVVYHSADYDGIFCREIARKFLPDAELIGWNYGDPLLPFPEGKVYVLDLSPECFDAMLTPAQIERLIWIDHHKTAIDKFPAIIPGYRIDGVAASRLAWQWFRREDYYHGDQRNYPKPKLPSKTDFIEREVSEPLAVRMAGEYDIWDKRDVNAETFQYGLRLVDEGADFWEALLQSDGVGEKAVEDTLGHGRIAQRYCQRTDASICEAKSFLIKFEGLTFLCINTARFNSLFFATKDKPETGHDALLGFCFDGKTWMVSLYHAKHRTDLDLSEICKRYGGGGHRGACGFTTKHLPWQILC